MSIMDAIEEEAEKQQATDAEIEQIADLAQRQKTLDKEIDKMQESLDQVKEQRRKVAEEDLPAALDQAGVSDVTLSDGSRIAVKSDLKVNIPKSKKEDAAEWLVNQGASALVKEDIHVPFNRGQEEQVNELTRELEENGYTYNVQPEMHTGSVKKFLKEHMEEGGDLPEDVMNVFYYRETEIK